MDFLSISDAPRQFVIGLLECGFEDRLVPGEDRIERDVRHAGFQGDVRDSLINEALRWIIRFLIGKVCACI